MSVIDDLKRLERAGNDCSETNRKLCAAADRVLRRVIYAVEKQRPGFPLPDKDPLELPRGYRLGYIVASELEEDQPGYEPANADGSGTLKLRVEKTGSAVYVDGIYGVGDARMIARDVAGGWLGELAEWVRKRGQEDEALVSSIGAAKEMTLERIVESCHADRIKIRVARNNCIANDPCAICGGRCDPCGLDYFFEDSQSLVCDSCAEEHVPELAKMRSEALAFADGQEAGLHAAITEQKLYFVMLRGRLPWITGCSKPDETPEEWCAIKRRSGGLPSEEAFSEEDLRKLAAFCEENGIRFQPVPIQASEPMPEVSDLGPYGHGHYAGLDFCYFSSGSFWDRAEVRAWAAGQVPQAPAEVV